MYNKTGFVAVLFPYVVFGSNPTRLLSLAIDVNAKDMLAKHLTVLVAAKVGMVTLLDRLRNLFSLGLV